MRLDEGGSVTIVRPRQRSRGGSARRRHTYEVLTASQPGQRAELSRHTLAAGGSTGAEDDPPMHEPGSRETALVESGSVACCSPMAAPPPRYRRLRERRCSSATPLRMDTLVQVLEGEVIVPRVINPRVARDLERICLRCLEKLPERRYATAAALAEDLERFVRDEPVQARPPGLRPWVRHWIRRQPALAWRLAGLGICIVIGQATFQFYRSVSLAQHLRIMSALGLWALLSAMCQWALERERWNPLMPFVWAAVDAACLTGVLWLDEAMTGPLIGAFPVLVAASGLWFRAPVVAVTTVLTMLGYSFLVLDDALRRHRLEQVNWHVAFLVFLLLTGCAVAYQVHRVRALSRFYGRRD